MSVSSPECVVFGAGQLLPEAWKTFVADGPVRTFNPGLLGEPDGWIFAYRIVAHDGQRRIGICRLDRAFGVVDGSQIPLTDRVRFRTGVEYPAIARQWFADPRLYRFGDRVFVYWNSGWHEPRNYQFVQELDPETLAPRGYPRELILRGERQKLEKNWTFFATGDDRLHAVYSITPHRVLEFSLQGEGDILFEETSRIDWSIEDYPANHGGLRGGAPPCFADGQYWSFCHTVHDGPRGYRYAPAAYSFAAIPPFAPMNRPTRPIKLGNPFGEARTYERLNTAVSAVIYPCGAARDGARWIVSHGINDEYCAISIVPHESVLETLRSMGATKGNARGPQQPF
jgi:hypothetical protein